MAALTDLNNEQLVVETRNGNTDALDILLHRFKHLVKVKASAYYITGGDREDIIQEGMIGLYKAVRDYVPEKRLSFYAFAELCVSRQIMTAIKTSARNKHLPLNTSLPLNEWDTAYDQIFAGHSNDPETLLIRRETADDIGTALQKHLSSLEYDVLMLHLQGRRYTDIAQITGKNIKSVDNTLQRIRRKMEKIIHTSGYGSMQTG